MTWLDLHEGILGEFAERSAYALSPEDGLGVRWTNGRQTNVGSASPAVALEGAAKASEAKRYAAIKADPERLARRRETARKHAEKKRREAGVGTTRGRPRKEAA